MPTPKQPTFEVGEKVTINGLHRNYTPTILKIEYGKATVHTPELAGSERTFKVHDLEKLKEKR